MTERLVIDRLAHRGDGVADTPAGPLYVPYTLPGETVEVERVPGQPDRRHLLRVETASPERIAPFCPHFGDLRRLRDPALDGRALSRMEARPGRRRRSRRPASTRRSTN